MNLKCRICGENLKVTEGDPVCGCEFCGGVQTVPCTVSDKVTVLFNRANRLRMEGEFERARAVYVQLTSEFPEEPEGWWGICLCDRGVTWEDDPAAGTKRPVCALTCTDPLQEDANFEQACDFAAPEARRLYRDDARSIARIQREYAYIAANQPPCDVFICFKETGEDGGRTEDSVLAERLETALSAAGLRVFTCAGLSGRPENSEPLVCAALNSAKVMLAVGTSYENYDDIYVRRTWSRYLRLAGENGGKTLIPCCRGLDAYDIPSGFRGLKIMDPNTDEPVREAARLCGKELPAEDAGGPVVPVSAPADASAAARPDTAEEDPAEDIAAGAVITPYGIPSDEAGESAGETAAARPDTAEEDPAEDIAAGAVISGGPVFTPYGIPSDEAGESAGETAAARPDTAEEDPAEDIAAGAVISGGPVFTPYGIPSDEAGESAGETAAARPDAAEEDPAEDIAAGAVISGGPVFTHFTVSADDADEIASVFSGAMTEEPAGESVEAPAGAFADEDAGEPDGQKDEPETGAAGAVLRKMAEFGAAAGAAAAAGIAGAAAEETPLRILQNMTGSAAPAMSGSSAADECIPAAENRTGNVFPPVPDVKIPDIEAPGDEAFGMPSADVEIPDVRIPDVGISGMTAGGLYGMPAAAPEDNIPANESFGIPGEGPEDAAAEPDPAEDISADESFDIPGEGPEDAAAEPDPAEDIPADELFDIPGEGPEDAAAESDPAEDIPADELFGIPGEGPEDAAAEPDPAEDISADELFGIPGEGPEDAAAEPDPAEDIPADELFDIPGESPEDTAAEPDPDDGMTEEEKTAVFETAVSAEMEQDFPAAIDGYLKLGDFRGSAVRLDNCVQLYRMQLKAADNAPAGADPRLAEAEKKVKRFERELAEAEEKAGDTRRKRAEMRQRSIAIPDEIRAVTDEVDRARGVFAGSRRRELQQKINVLNIEYDQIRGQLAALQKEEVLSGSFVDDAAGKLDAARKELEEVRADIDSQTEQERWSDEAVLRAAAAALAERGTRNEALDRFRRPGNIVVFGSYYIRNAAVKEPVEWQVLDYDRQNDRTLLISRQALDCRPYSEDNRITGIPEEVIQACGIRNQKGMQDVFSLTWETCTLREWLDNTFLWEAFSDTERRAVAETSWPAGERHYNGRDPADKAFAGMPDSVRNRVFLPDEKEVRRYFPETVSGKCTATPYAVQQGALSEVNGADGTCWLLRDQKCVHSSFGIERKESDIPFSVRPALWLDLKKLPE